MDKTRTGILSGGAAVLAASVLAVTIGQNQPDAPTRGDAPATNVVFILVDTLRYDKLQTYGYKINPTSPNIESFSDKSVVFDNAFAQASWTKPSVASMLTSRLPKDLGLYDWDHSLDPGFLTLSEHLQAQGFHTEAHFSHIAFLADKTNFNQGFNVYNGSVLKKGSPHKVMSSREITDAGINFLKEEQHDRFFLWLHYFDPHYEYLKHKKFRFGKQRRALYDGEIAFTDHHLGRLFETLRETGRLADTVVVLVSDHGEGLGQHGINKHTSALYEQQIHIPLIIYAPWMTAARRGEIVSAMDLAPTLLDMLGVPTPEDFQGKAIPLTSDGFAPEPDRVSYAETRRFANLRSVVSDGWKLIEDQDSGETQLFNIIEDPDESKDWSEHNAEQLATMKALLEVYTKAPQREPGVVALDEEMTQGLKSLGYIE